jgi:hypothetical protein
MSGSDERRHERQQDGQEQARRTPAEQADDPSGAEGQVSEVGNLSRAEEPVSDDQSVAASPDPDVDEGPTGPNARAGSNKN